MVAAKSSEAPAPYERRGKTRAEEAAEMGVCVQWLRKLRAKQRRGEIPDDVPDHDPEELPYVPLVDDPGQPGYLLDSSSPKLNPGHESICAVESGTVRIGGGGMIDNGGGGPSQRCPTARLEGRLLIRNVNGGRPLEVPKKKPAPKFKPKSKAKKKRPAPAA
jgi:hypothetical protein